MSDFDTSFIRLKRHETTQGHVAENKSWGRGESKIFKQLGLVNHLSFSKAFPPFLAVTTETRVVLYDEKYKPCRSITKFADQAYCGTFREDGKLLAAGGESGTVQIFDSTNHASIRRLVGHSRAVHSIGFLTSKYEMLSGGDDSSVRLWDIPEGKTVSAYKGHTDYVRSVSISPSDHNVWASGGYDHVCNLWDRRSHSEREPSARLRHGDPVEALSFHPSGNIICSAGGPNIYTWDLRVCKLLHTLKPHQKTITSILFSTIGDSESFNLLSSSLDGYCKTIDFTSFSVINMLRHSQPITSMAVSPGSHSLALGMADGTLWIRCPKRMSKKTTRRDDIHERKANTRFGSNTGVVKLSDISLIERREKAGLAGYDRLLRKFSYNKALEIVLRTDNVEVLIVFITEMISRGALEAALSKVDVQQMTWLINFIGRHIRSPRMSLPLTHLCQKVLDLYPAEAPENVGGFITLLNSFCELRNIMIQEIRLQDELLILKGLMLGIGM